MSEIRKDPIIDRCVVIAPQRAARPQAAKDPVDFADLDLDPFLEGHEQETPSELFAFPASGREPDKPGWRVRVVPNKYPALQYTNNEVPRSEPFYEQQAGVGEHEVIVESPHSEFNMSQLPKSAIAEVFQAYSERMQALKLKQYIKYIHIFKNKGVLAGASLPHGHSQLLATPWIPSAVSQEITSASDYYTIHQQSVYQAILQYELASQTRIVLETDHFVAFCPYASRFPYEIMIMPRLQQCHYHSVSNTEIEDLAGMLKTVLLKLEIGLNDPAYNYMLQSAPIQEQDLPSFRWHLIITPRLTRVAGFEWGTGCFINPVAPEQAADILRGISISPEKEPE